MDLGNDFITMDVVLETMLGIAVAVAGALWNAGAFQPIDGSHQFNRVYVGAAKLHWPAD